MEALPLKIKSSKRSPLWGDDRGGNDPINKSSKNATGIPTIEYSDSLVSSRSIDNFEELLRTLFMRTSMIGNIGPTNGRGSSLNILQGLMQKIKLYLGTNPTSPANKSRCSYTHFENCTPVIPKTAGPLKKRIKHRCSLDSISLPFTPSGLFNFTPDFTAPMNDTPFTESDLRTPLFRSPLMNISPNVVLQFQDKNDHSNKKPTLGLSPSQLVQSKRINSDRTMSLCYSDDSMSATRKKKSVDIFSTSAGTTHKIKPPWSNDKLHHLVLTPKLLKVGLSPQVPPIQGEIPARAQPTTMLPVKSPILSKTNQFIQPSSGNDNVTFVSSYMCLIRQQFEFFELTPEEVSLCKARNVSVSLGQVVLRCRHCSCISIAFRPKGSLVVAKMHMSLYKHFKNGTSNHAEELCPFVPRSTRKKLQSLRSRSSLQQRTSFWQDYGYWCALARADGVLETDKGLRFKSSLMTAMSNAPFSFQRDPKPLLHVQEHKNPTLYDIQTWSAASPFATGPICQAFHGKKMSQKKRSMHQQCDTSQNNTGFKKPKLLTESLSPKLKIKDGDKKAHLLEKKPIFQQKDAKISRQDMALKTWSRRLKEFIDFKNNNGHGRVPQQYPENRALGIWVNKQRMAKRAKDAGKVSTMTIEKMKLLEEAGFIWAKSNGEDSWDERFSELQKFYEENGNCDVPTKRKKLGRWVSMQRANYKKYRETGQIPKHVGKKEMDRRIRLLDEMNFSWSWQRHLLKNDSGNGKNNLKEVIAPISAHCRSA